MNPRLRTKRVFARGAVLVLAGAALAAVVGLRGSQAPAGVSWDGSRNGVAMAPGGVSWDGGVQGRAGV
jgi:hypothetical protein